MTAAGTRPRHGVLIHAAELAPGSVIAQRVGDRLVLRTVINLEWQMDARPGHHGVARVDAQVRETPTARPYRVSYPPEHPLIVLDVPPGVVARYWACLGCTHRTSTRAAITEHTCWRQ